jgi:CRP/FNR family transcriptional regulator
MLDMTRSGTPVPKAGTTLPKAVTTGMPVPRAGATGATGATVPRAGTSCAACATCPARTRGICGAMGPEAHALIAAAAHRVEVPANRALWPSDRDPGVVAILREGYLRVQRHSAEGQRQVVSILLPGEVVGDEVTARPGYDVEAATAAVVCRVDRRVWDTLTRQQSGLRRALLALRTARLDRLRWATWAIGALRPEERLAGFFALATRVMGFVPDRRGGGVLTLEVPRLDIADFLGTTVESFSRITHKMERDGVIEILDPTRFRIPDLERLIRLGCLDGTFETIRFPQDVLSTRATMTPVNARQGLAAR